MGEPRYTFVTEDGHQELTYEEYLGPFAEINRQMVEETFSPTKKDVANVKQFESDLMRKVKDNRRANLCLGSTLISYDDAWLREHPATEDEFRALEEEQRKNPLAYFMPHGAQLDFLNDTTSTVKIAVAPNRWGKTVAMWLDILLDLIPCDPDWWIFSRHGVKWRPYAPPRNGWRAAMCTYTRALLEDTIWPGIIKLWTPREHLGEYAEGKKRPSFRDIPRVQTDTLDIVMYTYEQGQEPYESSAIPRWGWDEQGEEPKFDGANQRCATLRGRHVFALTPHKVPGRPDTGAGSWIHEMVKGRVTKGHSVKVYHGNLIRDTPDWVHPETTKVEKWWQYVTEPRLLQLPNVEAEGRARLFGEWHSSSGLVFDDWSRRHHVIDPFPIPTHWTRWRGIDHGIRNPTACVWAAVSPEGYVVFYRAYCEVRTTIYRHCHEIIQRSGNSMAVRAHINDRVSGLSYTQYDENPVTERYYQTVMDYKCFSKPGPTLGGNLGDEYRAHGVMVQPSEHLETGPGLAICKQYMRIIPDRDHPYNAGVKGCPHFFVFRTCENLIEAIESYVWKEVTKGGQVMEKPRDIDDHLPDSVRYLLTKKPVYVDGWVCREDDFDLDIPRRRVKKRRTRDKFCAY